MISEVMPLPCRVRLLIAGYPELIAVLAAAVFGLSVRQPPAWLAARQGDQHLAGRLGLRLWVPRILSRP